MKGNKNYMKVKLLIIALLGLFFSLNNAMARDTNKPAANFRTIEQNAFGTGEKLTFDINYGFVTAGTRLWKSIQILQINERDVYDITFLLTQLLVLTWSIRLRIFTKHMLTRTDCFPGDLNSI